MELRPSRNKTDGSGSFGKKCCKVLGCTVDVAALGNYCSRKRVCPFHLKADAVHVQSGGDQLYRFCQQCGKLEPLSCFIGAHRSCKSRLARRRFTKHLSRIGTIPQPAAADNSGSSTQHTDGLLQQQQQQQRQQNQAGMHSMSVMQLSDDNMHNSADSTGTAGVIEGTYGWATLPTSQTAAAATAAANVAGGNAAVAAAAAPTAGAPSVSPDVEGHHGGWHAAMYQKLQQHTWDHCAAAAAVLSAPSPPQQHAWDQCAATAAAVPPAQQQQHAWDHCAAAAAAVPPAQLQQQQQQHAWDHCGSAAAAVPQGQQSQYEVLANGDHLSVQKLLRHGATAEVAMIDGVWQAVQTGQQQQQQQQDTICVANGTDLTDRYHALKPKVQMAAAGLAETASAVQAVQAVQQLRRSSSKGSNMLGDDQITPDLHATLDDLEQLGDEDLLLLLLEQEMDCSGSAVQAVQHQSTQYEQDSNSAIDDDNIGTVLPDRTFRSGATLEKLNSTYGAELQSFIEQELRAAAQLGDDSPVEVLCIPAAWANPLSAGAAATTAAAAAAAAAASIAEPCLAQPQALRQHAQSSKLDRNAILRGLVMSSNKVAVSTMPGSSSCTPTAAAAGTGNVALPAVPLGFSTTADEAPAANPSLTGVHALLQAAHPGPMLTPHYLLGQPPLPLLLQQGIPFHNSQLPVIGLEALYGAPCAAPPTCHSARPVYGSSMATEFCLPTATAAAAAAVYAAAGPATAADVGVGQEAAAAAGHGKVDMLLLKITHLQHALLKVRHMHS